MSRFVLAKADKTYDLARHTLYSIGLDSKYMYISRGIYSSYFQIPRASPKNSLKSIPVGFRVNFGHEEQGPVSYSGYF
jgi:hypothetical protein